MILRFQMGSAGILFLSCLFGSILAVCQESAPSGGGADALVGHSARGANPDSGGEIAYQPPGLTSYQNYLQVIAEGSGPSVSIRLEATVLHLRKNAVCPYREEDCPIEPYPEDWGTVRVDEVLSSQRLDVVEERSQRSATGHEGRRAGGDSGRPPNPPRAARAPLRVAAGQEVTTQFLFTARPVILRWVPLEPQGDDWERTTDRAAPGRNLPYESLPREGEAYLLIVGTTAGPEPEERRLPGLAFGSRFRASAAYDGVLRIRAYELLP